MLLNLVLLCTVASPGPLSPGVLSAETVSADMVSDPMDSELGRVAKKGKKKGKADPDLEEIPDESEGGGGGGWSNTPSPYGSGYPSWGTHGGATLGGVDGVRGGLTAGRWGRYGFSFSSIEGYYFLAMDEDFDLGLGGQLNFWWFGLSPGVKIRYRLLNMDQFQLAIEGDVHLGFLVGPGGPGGSFYFGLGLEVGAMASYFIRDNMEVFFGLKIPVTFVLVERFGAIVGWDIRAGFVYTLKSINLGVYGQLDLVPSVVAHDNRNLWYTRSGFLFVAGFSAGVQYRFD